MITRILLTVILLFTFAFAHAESPWRADTSGAVVLAKKWDELSADEKRRVKQAQERYKELPREKKEKLRDKWEKMPKKEKEKYKLERKFR